ncbi:hypothetical protein FHS09_000047 [Microbulbifer rhizosphaerae]|uniref:Uncharacterized protein n=1 Tax=Microbulbifer rhizosphaerae TaxID=1562603 RepID=A0A7W4Z7A1_9GAMM|nr:hypothetical protein [Microbulbifer rhizosphaerae]
MYATCVAEGSHGLISRSDESMLRVVKEGGKKTPDKK